MGLNTWVKAWDVSPGHLVCLSWRNWFSVVEEAQGGIDSRVVQDLWRNTRSGGMGVESAVAAADDGSDGSARTTAYHLVHHTQPPTKPLTDTFYTRPRSKIVGSRLRRT